jgi:hypothetical protein
LSDPDADAYLFYPEVNPASPAFSLAGNPEETPASSSQGPPARGPSGGDMRRNLARADRAHGSPAPDTHAPEPDNTNAARAHALADSPGSSVFDDSTCDSVDSADEIPSQPAVQSSLRPRTCLQQGIRQLN